MMTCPECGARMIHMSGCFTCICCGHSCEG